MVEIEQLKAQARKCRRLALGLSNREDVRTLEKLAAELEDQARRRPVHGLAEMARSV